MPMFTQANYAEQMLRDPSRGYVLHASWIDQDTILTDAQAKTAWDRKQAEEPLALLFAGRLIASKGIADLLEAVADASMPMRLDVIGEGELKHEVVAAVASGKVRLLEPVAYGPEFFDLLRRYHALVVPSRSDEQPRIVYDAYSQAVPVIGTRTAGILACVAEGKTGWLAPIADVAGLRATIQRAEGDRAALRRMGMEGLHFARKYTHREMHRRRRIALGKALGI